MGGRKINLTRVTEGLLKRKLSDNQIFNRISTAAYMREQYCCLTARIYYVLKPTHKLHHKDFDVRFYVPNRNKIDGVTIDGQEVESKELKQVLMEVMLKDESN